MEAVRPLDLTALRFAAPPLKRDAFDARVIVRAETHYIRVVFQRIVNNPPVIGIHRFELDRSTGDSDGVGDLTDPLTQLVVPHRPPMADIDLNPVRISIVSLENSIQEKLQIFERLAVVTDQRFTFGRKNLELAAPVGLDFLDIHNKAEITKHRV
jgi:hypothetical protein